MSAFQCREYTAHAEYLLVEEKNEVNRVTRGILHRFNSASGAPYEICGQGIAQGPSM